MQETSSTLPCHLQIISYTLFLVNNSISHLLEIFCSYGSISGLNPQKKMFKLQKKALYLYYTSAYKLIIQLIILLGLQKGCQLFHCHLLEKWSIMMGPLLPQSLYLSSCRSKHYRLLGLKLLVILL